MAPRIRTIRPEMLDDELLGRCPIGPRLLAYGLIHIADDDGRFRASPTFLKARVFAYNDDLLPTEVGGWINHLASVGFVALYTDENQTYGWMPNWRKHQRIDKPSPSLLPSPEDSEPVNSTNVRRAFDEPSPKPPGIAVSVPTYSDVLTISHEQRDSGQFDERSAKGREASASPREDSGAEGNGREGNGGDGKGRTSLEHPDFASWLKHHNAITGQTTPREGTAHRGEVASMYAARRRENYTAEELCFATVGAFNDEFRREKGAFGCVSVLRPKKVHDLIEKGRRGKPVAPVATGAPASAEARRMERQQRRMQIAHSEEAA